MKPIDQPIKALLLLLFLMGCSEDFLDKKSSKSLTVPQTVKDFWALLDNNEIMQLTPALGQLATDDYYFDYKTWNAQTGETRTCYIWDKKVFASPTNQDWNICYKQVYYANCVLDGVANIPVSTASQPELNSIRGSALFMRAYALYNLAETFSKPYNVATVKADLGIPLRLSSDLAEKSFRSTLQKTYDQVLSDLMQAKDLVPAQLSDNKSRPSKPAVLALLARIYLSMRSYELAKNYADSALAVYDKLLDYNTVNAALNTPFNNKNPEVLYQSYLYNYFVLISPSNTLVDTVLLRSYAANDLRKNIFFRANGSGNFFFKGKYTAGPSYMFSGLATDELYLIRAEAHVRAGNVKSALQDLNTLLEKRWKAGTFIPLTTSGAGDALKLILNERRKQLLFRGLRWTDLRRLNQQSELVVTLSRSLNGQIFELLPNDPRYVYPIPDIEISLSGLEQNER